MKGVSNREKGTTLNSKGRGHNKGSFFYSRLKKSGRRLQKNMLF